jgi:flagellar biosynthesis GTPase FlhF
MEVVQFIARDTTAALAQIHRQLGPDAIVLSVRPMPAQGAARLWSKNGRFEVLAGLPDASTTEESGFPSQVSQHGDPADISTSNLWRSVAWLEAMGLLPAHAARLQALLHALHEDSPPPSLEAEWDAVSNALNAFWRTPPPFNDGCVSRPHVFVGPPGCGKTTVLCKWLTLATLTEERLARVWRLDDGSANTAEFLTIHCEMLGAPVERFWSPPSNRAELLFVDLPGVETHDLQGLASLGNQLDSLPNPHIHLVLNGAYETQTLLSQWHAFAALNPEDLIFTHLDEEVRRVKLWNLVFGTNCTIRFLSAGQKIPGEFRKASPNLLFPPESSR